MLKLLSELITVWWATEYLHSFNISFPKILINYKRDIVGLQWWNLANKTFKNMIRINIRISLVVLWLGICLPMQETCIWSLDWEDPTCRGANEACMPQLLNPHSRPCALQRRATAVRSPSIITKSSPIRHN